MNCKFVLKSINNLHNEKYLNNLFQFICFSNSSRNTGSCCKNLRKHNAKKDTTLLDSLKMCEALQYFPTY